MIQLNRNNSIIILALCLLAFFSVQEMALNINLFALFLYVISLSFIRYKSVNEFNVLHISWIGICLSGSLFFHDFAPKAGLVALAPLSLMVHAYMTGKARAFLWTQGLSSLLFLASLWIYFAGEVKGSAIVAVLGVFARQAQLPFHIWVGQANKTRELYPSFLFFLIAQTGLVLYADSFIHVLNFEGMNWLIAGVTLLTGLYLAAQALLEKNLLSRQLLVIISQGCLPLAGYHSYSSVSATGGVLFALLLALGGAVFGMSGYHLVLQKGALGLNQFHSLYRENKSFAVGYFIAGLSLVGLPFTIGFVSEDILFHGLIVNAPALATLYIMMAAINAFTVFQTFNFLFFGHTQKKWSKIYMTLPNKVCMALALVAIVGTGLFPGRLAQSVEGRLIRWQGEAKVHDLKNIKGEHV